VRLLNSSLRCRYEDIPPAVRTDSLISLLTRTCQASVGQEEHVVRCSTLMLQFAARISAQKQLTQLPSWAWLEEALKDFCEVRVWFGIDCTIRGMVRLASEWALERVCISMTTCRRATRSSSVASRPARCLS
jgi:hypothetical protein